MIQFSVLKINFEPFGNILKKEFFIRGMEIIPFPVWIIQFPVLKINFEPLGSNKKHLLKGDFLSQAWKLEK